MGPLQLSGQLFTVSSPRQVASIFLPTSLFQFVAENTSRTGIGLVFSVFNDNTFFPLRETTTSGSNTTRRLAVASPVLTSTVGLAMELKGLDPPLELSLSLLVNDGETVSLILCHLKLS